MDDIRQKIQQSLERGDEISPFLFVGENMELLNTKVSELAQELCGKHSVDLVTIKL